MGKSKSTEIIGKLMSNKLAVEINELMLTGMSYDEVIDVIELISYNLKRFAKNNSPVSNYFNY